MADPERYFAECRHHVLALDRERDATVRLLEQHARAPDATELARQRYARMVQAVEMQIADIKRVLDPIVPPARGVVTELPQANVPSPLTYIHYLYRDWGWDPAPDDENALALALLEHVRNDRPVGRMIVLGAGACRLAYDLHRRDAAAETVVVDVDPFVFTVAEAVVRGDTVTVTEATAEISELGRTSTRWKLVARDGSIDAERFHFLIADGLVPPFAPGAFDTVVTSWFIDLVPVDLRPFLTTVSTLLKQGGQWLNLGPLRYPRDVPLDCRFTREEIFDLAERRQLAITRWRTASVPYLVSRTSGRGRVEYVIAVAATKCAG
jgi:hypothetical protein